MRVVVQSLLEIFAFRHQNYEHRHSVKAPRTLEESLLASSGRSGICSTGTRDGHSASTSLTAFVVVLCVAVLVTGIAWLWLKDKQRKAKKLV